MLRFYKSKTETASETLIERALTEIREGNPVHQMALKRGGNHKILRSRLSMTRSPSASTKRSNK